MAETRDPNKRAKDVGSDSPASEEAAEQTKSGMQGAPRGEGEAGGSDEQPSQSSGRSGPGPEPYATKSFDKGSRPSDQGEGDPKPERVKERDSLQGQGRGAGGQQESARGEDEATVHEK